MQRLKVRKALCAQRKEEHEEPNCQKFNYEFYTLTLLSEHIVTTRFRGRYSYTDLFRLVKSFGIGIEFH